ncbi:hypothetical protein J0X14_07085 [Muricauda sp. CAU 1633]|uniref:hypothetical protein n=1 Tax=Allomuricauda sp. CAU 1633 TaxID=2816036 RepID=UPI001A8CA011|nr:hypothetical protein [Muricauda sp. CAU 1633]MBO0322055.1 hypothetical protein [Muricauda sp. CAU 1633]
MNDKKTVNVLLKSISHFNFKNVEIESSQEIESLVKDTFQNINFDEIQVDFLFTEQMNASKFATLFSEGRLHNGSMILINGIHQDRQKQQEWENLIASPNITVSIDMFHCGALFIRKEQVKEHFTIRI